jgi:hypothetical protein
MFELLKPQVARHSSGFIVEVRARDQVALRDADGSEVLAEVEFGPVSTVYRKSLTRHDPSGVRVAMTSEEGDDAASRILEGLEAMGGTYELV